MFGLAARRLGYRLHVLASDHDGPASQVADRAVQAAYDDVDRIREFARTVDVLTFEFENISLEAAAAAGEVTCVRPTPRALAIAQHRIEEKTFLQRLGLPVAPFEAVRSDSDLVSALQRIGRPAVLKTAALGYDGKGQIVIREGDDPLQAWSALDRREAILEAFVELDREISVIGARGPDGVSVFFDPFENTHRNHILDISVVPADVGDRAIAEAVDATRSVLDAFDYVGVLCVEFFISRDDRLLINEIAPRTHNSGHLTIDACRTSQFEQHVRAVCGIPLGSTELIQPAAAMANLLGDLWESGEPAWAAALAFPGVKLHLYGKTEARPGRKMGHLTALGRDREAAKNCVERARDAVRRVG
jgi:5-(carboxyamino)imidazole ribonucleotide synthase